MRLHRFYITESVGPKREVSITSSELSHQIRTVFRKKVGDEVVLFDGSGTDYKCVIDRMTGKNNIVFTVRESARASYMPTRKIILAAAIVKKDNFELIAEKATELGVTDIIPVVADRTEKKLVNMERLQKIVIEAGEQSGRGDVPHIHAVTNLKDSLEGFSSVEELQKIAFHTDGELFDRKDIDADKPVMIFVGPEGGWSPEEVDVFHKNDVLVRCLGNQVLRAETAVVATLSQLVFTV